MVYNKIKYCEEHEKYSICLEMLTHKVNINKKSLFNYVLRVISRNVELYARFKKKQ